MGGLTPIASGTRVRQGSNRFEFENPSITWECNVGRARPNLMLSYQPELSPRPESPIRPLLARRIAVMGRDSCAEFSVNLVTFFSMLVA